MSLLRFTRAALCLMLSMVISSSDACNLPFEPTLAAAQAKAAKRSWPVLMLFCGLDWSPRSILLDKRLLEHSAVEDFIEKSFIPLLVDFPQRVKLTQDQQLVNLDLAQRFKVSHFPTLIALSADGKEIGRLAYQEETVESLIRILQSWCPPQASSAPAK